MSDKKCRDMSRWISGTSEREKQIKTTDADFYAPHVLQIQEWNAEDW